ncbi:hypothetical protein [Actinoplanes sp. N902-109]|uniref:hypothetical protein n=1 Tax=Actinoplanes sp. (strain N902-109) TaxID=649831 RepID=UPI0003294D44|nr:hypothetical protein [Actinoplanes sp. N902-109]AGL21249.1 hypothetical protein L083_7739 [Actinoplanes sp. N902-109]
MRLTPFTVFLGLVVLGLPFAVSTGWMLGSPGSTPVAVTAAPGAGPAASIPAATSGSGPAPSSPARSSTRPVAVVERVRPWSSHRVPRSKATPSASVSSVPEPTLAIPPVPTPTEVVTDGPSASPVASDSGKPKPSQLGGLVQKR